MNDIALSTVSAADRSACRSRDEALVRVLTAAATATFDSCDANE
jgi:hypothetical protein